MLRKVDCAILSIGLSTALGVLGMPGMTAYRGLIEIGKPKSGETVVVAAATGPVGSLVGQIAKIKGCRVVGVAGGAKKCKFAVEELGFDACIDHYQADMAKQLKAACPNGIDVYFENVGGAVLASVVPLLNDFARVPVCGLIAHYNATSLPAGPDRTALLMTAILVKRLTVQGFIVTDDYSCYPKFVAEVTQWIKEGRIHFLEDITEGLAQAPAELIALLRGQNFGKKLIRVGSDQRSRL